MIERIRLENDEERYAVKIGSGEVVVIMALNGSIKVIEAESMIEKAVLQQYETWTASNPTNSYYLMEYIIQATQTTGADFLIVRYYR